MSAKQFLELAWLVTKFLVYLVAAIILSIIVVIIVDAVVVSLGGPMLIVPSLFSGVLMLFALIGLRRVCIEVKEWLTS